MIVLPGLIQVNPGLEIMTLVINVYPLPKLRSRMLSVLESVPSGGRTEAQWAISVDALPWEDRTSYPHYSPGPVPPDEVNKMSPFLGPFLESLLLSQKFHPVTRPSYPSVLFKLQWTTATRWRQIAGRIGISLIQLLRPTSCKGLSQSFH